MKNVVLASSVVSLLTFCINYDKLSYLKDDRNIFVMSFVKFFETKVTHNKIFILNSRNSFAAHFNLLNDFALWSFEF